jgi:uncharacterized protein YjgD (DUF1641 family)
MKTISIPSGVHADQRLEHISQQLDELTAELRRERARRDAWEELLADAAPVARQALTSAIGRLDEAERRGYLGFARSGAGVVDRVVASFSEDDVEALGDNIVLILETVKEMTQPEVMAMLRRTVAEVSEPADDPTGPPTLRALLRELRDPDVRRGLARLLAMLRTLGTQTAQHREVQR